MQREFDVVVLGAGNAGNAAAWAVREAGRSVALVEERDAGGTCPLRGCVPKKVLVAAAEVLDTIHRADRHGISVGRPQLDWKKLIQRKRTFVEDVPAKLEKSYRDQGIEYVRETARFSGPHEVNVSGETLRAAKFVVAVGSKPRSLPIEGFEHTITSDDILEMEVLPKELVFIGGGVIAMEFTHVFARAGTKVTILEAMPRLLPMIDPEVVGQLAEATRALGVEIHAGVKVQEIRRSAEGLEVRFEKDGQTRAVQATVVANGAGRVPALDALDLARAGVKLEKGHPVLRPDLSAEGNPDLYFAGDAYPGLPQLSPVATWTGRIAANNLLGREAIIPDYSSVPSVVFSVPAIASVGESEETAKKKGLHFDLKREDMRSWRSSRTYGEDLAFAKVLVEPNGGRVLGAHLAGHCAQELIHPFALAIRFGITSGQLKDFVYAYPTFHSDLSYLL
jgi:glutathione reductase (NADPH)